MRSADELWVAPRRTALADVRGTRDLNMTSGTAEGVCRVEWVKAARWQCRAWRKRSTLQALFVQSFIHGLGIPTCCTVSPEPVRHFPPSRTSATVATTLFFTCSHFFSMVPADVMLSGKRSLSYPVKSPILDSYFIKAPIRISCLDKTDSFNGLRQYLNMS